MTYFVSLVMVIVAALFVLLGVAVTNAVPYAIAAVLSAAAMVLLFKRSRSNHERTFVTDAPNVAAPQWDRPITRSAVKPVPEGLEVPIVAIDNYDDLVAAEVLPSLETLSVDELQDIILHEQHGMARVAIIHRAEVLIDLTLGAGSAERLTAAPRQRRNPEPEIGL